MGFVNRRGKQLFIALSNKESMESGLVDGKRYDLIKAGEGKWLLVENKSGKQRQSKQAVSEKTQQAKYPAAENPEQKKEKGQDEKQGSSKAEPALGKDGFMVCKNTNEAKALSLKLKESIEKGEVRGIKGFDGMFYIAENTLYQKHRKKVLEMIEKEKGVGSGQISERLGISEVLARIVCELLKEDGEIIEKRKDQYQAV